MSNIFLKAVTVFTIALFSIESYHYLAPESWCWLSERQLSGITAMTMGCVVFLVYKTATSNK